MMQLVNDKITRWMLVVSGMLLLYHIGYILLFFAKLPPIVPLFNQLPWGEARLGPKLAIFVPFLVCCGTLIINLLFAAFLYEKMPLISRIVTITTFLVCLLGSIFIFHTMQLMV